MRNNLKAARELAGYNQEQFADAVGVRRSTVSEWETQDKTIRPYYIKPIRDILGDDPHLFDIEPVPRDKLRAVREAADLSQQELADLIGAEEKSVSGWEKGTHYPQPGYRRRVREQLHNYDDDLFYKKELFPREPSHVETTGSAPVAIRQSSIAVQEPCHMPGFRDTVDSSDPAPFIIRIPGSVRGLRELMELFRRQFLDFLAKVGGASLFGNVSLALVSAPTVDPEEYLAQASASIDACWELLSHGSFRKVEKALNTHMPTLTRFAHTLSPFQGMAANLAVQAKIMLAALATMDLDYFARETHCADAIHFGQLSGNRTLLAIALDWQGMTYVHCFRQPERAIPLFNTALSGLDNDSLLIKSALYIDLSVACAQDTTQENHETKAREYAELAHIAMPSYPELDPFYEGIRMGKSELEQAEGKMYLYLAEHFPNSDYAKLAHDAFNKATSKKSMSLGYRAQALTRKADSLRALGQMDESVKCLTNGFLIAVEINSKRPLREISDVLNGIPESWQRETSVQKLQKDLSRAILVARR
jgi:DNA-binding XRE family transcriptional regulator